MTKTYNSASKLSKHTKCLRVSLVVVPVDVFVRQADRWRGGTIPPCSPEAWGPHNRSAIRVGRQVRKCLGAETVAGPLLDDDERRGDCGISRRSKNDTPC